MPENNNDELKIILEGITTGRLQVESLQKREMTKKKTKYTIIVGDQAVPERTGKAKEIIKKENQEPKEKAVTKKPDAIPVPSVKPQMADISRVGGY